MPLAETEKQRQIAKYRAIERLETAEQENDAPLEAIAALVERAREKLDPETLLADEERPTKDERRVQRNRVVLVGGPGQGKSTASLFLTQIFRAAILENQAATRRDHNVKTLVPEILNRATTENISRAVPLRYPIQISLPRFADSISSSRHLGHKLPSLLAHIATTIEISSDQPIDGADVRDWLRFYPWIVILDGLDEVPPSGERPAIIEAIANFFTEVSDANADVLVVVTTRPQGYNKDLDEKLWDHWKLDELKPSQALKYAKAFGEARYPEDSQRRLEIHTQLLKAAAQPATARLMISPLQVTILHFIVDTGGGVPTARWTLFNEYFEVLKRREKAKGGETQRVLERNWLQLGPIHHRAGIVLQTDSEHSGGAGGKITHDRFRKLILAYLEAEGFSLDEISRRADELMGLALHRFVLLSTQEEGTLSFDVRSLQEFMAAAAITSGDEKVMVDRLTHIAGHSHWRHVFLIAASRCFADDSFHYRRPTVVSIPRQLDSIEPDALVRNGARLALDLLADGIGLDHPFSRRPLLQHAMELLTLGPNSFDDRLASVWDDSSSDLATIILSDHIAESPTSIAMSCWLLLIRMNDFGYQWAEALMIRLWPADSSEAMDILAHAEFLPKTQKTLDLWTRTIMDVGPTAAPRRLYRLFHRLDSKSNRGAIDLSRLRAALLAPLYAEEQNVAEYKLLVGHSTVSFDVRVTPLNCAEKFEAFDGAEFYGAPWTPLRAAGEFARDPSKKSLSKAIRDIASVGIATTKDILFILPWPIASIVSEAADENHLLEIAKGVESGDKGDREQWIDAEHRWSSKGIEWDDLGGLTSGAWFGRDIHRIGAPYWFPWSPRQPKRDYYKAALPLMALSKKISNKQIANVLLDTASTVLFGPMGKITDPQVAKDLLEFALSRNSLFLNCDLLSAIDESLWQLPDVVHKLAISTAAANTEYRDEELGDIHDIVVQAFNNFPHERDLLYLLAMSILEREPIPVESISQLSLEALKSKSTDSSRVKAAVAILRIILAAEDDAAKLVAPLVSVPLSEDGLRLARTLFGRDIIPLKQRLQLLTRMMHATRNDPTGYWRLFVDVFYRALDTRKSGLASREVWSSELKLPADSFESLLSPS